MRFSMQVIIYYKIKILTIYLNFSNSIKMLSLFGLGWKRDKILVILHKFKIKEYKINAFMWRISGNESAIDVILEFLSTTLSGYYWNLSIFS